MVSAEQDVHVQAKLFTKLKSYAIDDTPLSIPSTSGYTELNALIKGLLLNDGAEPPEFDFLFNGEFFQYENINAYIKEKDVSTESVIEIEYIVKEKEPEFEQSINHNDWISSVSMSGDLILTGTYDNFVSIWDRDGSLRHMEDKHKMAVKSVAFVSTENNENISFISASQDQRILIWHFNKTENKTTCVHSCRGHAGSVDALSVHSSKLKFASGSWDKMIKIWDSKVDFEATDEIADDKEAKQVRKEKSDLKEPTTRTPLVTLSGHKEPVSSVTWNGDQLISTGWDHCVRLWDIETATNTGTLTGNKVHLSVTFSQLNSLIATGSADKSIRLWDPRCADGSVVKSTLQSHNGWIPTVEWSRVNEHQLLSGSYDNSVKLWDIRSPAKSLFDLQSHKDKVMCVKWGDKKTILSGGADCQLHVSKLTDFQYNAVEE